MSAASNPAPGLLLEAAASRYAGRSARQFASNKLRFDPVFISLLRDGRLPDRGTLLDLGCGQGLLLALLLAGRDQFERGSWPRDWQRPPQLVLLGIEIDGERAATARRALGDGARVVPADIREAEFPACAVAVLLDVLLYMTEDEQESVLRKAVDALEPGGLLLVREADAGAGLKFAMTRWGERLMEMGRGQWRDRLHYRSASQWIALLSGFGLSVKPVAMSAGTPFANMLFVCTKSKG